MANTESFREFLLQALWYGSSSFDAWLNISAAKISTRILNIPQTAAQLGLPSAIVIELFQLVLGLWTQSVINFLYLKHKLLLQRNGHENLGQHTIQLDEVIGGLLGRKWKGVTLIFNIITLILISSSQIYGSSNIVYLMNEQLNKRTWTLIFGAIFSLSILVPSARNYRVWSFIGVITISFASAYLTIATLFNGKIENVKRTTPHSYKEYFTGISGMTFLGQVPIPVEIMDVMSKPQEYNIAYFYGTIFVMFIVMFPSIIMNINFGDNLLTKTTATSLLPESKFRDTTIVLIVAHAFINFGMYSNALNTMWEKVLGVHESPSYMKRTLSRLPIFLTIWLVALAFPMFGKLNRLADSLFASWAYYIIPCMAYIVLHWPKKRRQQWNSLTRLGWVVDFSVTLGVILWMVIMEVGLATWGNIAVLTKMDGVHLFASCYDC